MGSDVAPRFESKTEFVERVILRLSVEKHWPDRVVSKVVMPMLTGAVSANRYKAQQLMDQVCVDEQDRHSFRLHFMGMD